MISIMLVAHTRLSLGYVLDHYRLLVDNPGGKPKYDVMLEASYEVRRRAVAACPPLAERIRVASDLRADPLFAADRARLDHPLSESPKVSLVLLEAEQM
jgi:hypothetical protein